MPQISIIVPVYNTEKYLHRCIKSILSQSFTDFELLLINDGSTDNSGGICDEYSTKDPRIRVFNKTNGGVSAARNLGLENAKGEWITFIDSDDWIESEMLSTLTNNNIDAEVVLCNFYQHTSKGTFIKNLGSDYSNTIKRLQYWLQSYTTACCMLIKKDLCMKHNIEFPTSIRYREDFYFTTQVMFYAKYVHKINQPLYHYCNTNESSATHSSLSKEQFQDIMMMHTAVINFFRENGIIEQIEKELSHGIIRDKHILLFDSTLHQVWRDFFPQSHKYIKSCPYINWRIKTLSLLVSQNNFICNSIANLIINIIKKRQGI